MVRRIYYLKAAGRIITTGFGTLYYASKKSTPFLREKKELGAVNQLAYFSAYQLSLSIKSQYSTCINEYFGLLLLTIELNEQETLCPLC